MQQCIEIDVVLEQWDCDVDQYQYCLYWCGEIVVDVDYYVYVVDLVQVFGVDYFGVLQVVLVLVMVVYEYVGQCGWVFFVVVFEVGYYVGGLVVMVYQCGFDEIVVEYVFVEWLVFWQWWQVSVFGKGFGVDDCVVVLVVVFCIMLLGYVVFDYWFVYVFVELLYVCEQGVFVDYCWQCLDQVDVWIEFYVGYQVYDGVVGYQVVGIQDQYLWVVVIEVVYLVGDVVGFVFVVVVVVMVEQLVVFLYGIVQCFKCLFFGCIDVVVVGVVEYVEIELCQLFGCGN